jgi:hypothetical protein
VCISHVTIDKCPLALTARRRKFIIGVAPLVTLRWSD